MKTAIKRLGFFGVVSASFAWATLAVASPGEVSFTPQGLKLSVMQITLETTGDAGNPTSQAVLYTCPMPNAADCLVDVTSQTELDALGAAAGTAKVPVGVYDTISINLCAPGSNGEMPAPGFVKGVFSVASEGKTFATVADPANVTGIRELLAGEDVATAAEFMAIGNWACNQKSVKLAAPFTVSESSTTPLTVVMDAKFIAFSTPFVSPGMGGCRGVSNGQARGVCVSYPSIFPLVGELNPVLERFLIAHHRTDPTAIVDSMATGYVVVAREKAGGTPITAFVRPYYSDTSAFAFTSGTPDLLHTGPGYFGETVISTFHVNPDRSIAFDTGGSMDNGAVEFPAFMVADHVGTLQTRSQGTWQYHAIPVVETP